MPTYLYRLTLTRPESATDPTDDEVRIIGEHFQRLKALTEAGVVILAGRTEAAEFGIVIYEAEDDAAAEAIMNADPTVAQGVMAAECYPFRLALMRGLPTG